MNFRLLYASKTPFLVDDSHQGPCMCHANTTQHYSINLSLVSCMKHNTTRRNHEKRVRLKISMSPTNYSSQHCTALKSHTWQRKSSLWRVLSTDPTNLSFAAKKNPAMPTPAIHTRRDADPFAAGRKRRRSLRN